MNAACEADLFYASATIQLYLSSLTLDALQIRMFLDRAPRWRELLYVDSTSFGLSTAESRRLHANRLRCDYAAAFLLLAFSGALEAQSNSTSITIPTANVKIRPAASPTPTLIDRLWTQWQLATPHIAAAERSPSVVVDDKRGRGFDVFSGDILPTTCVDVDQPKDIMPGTQPGNVDLSSRIKDVSSLSDLRSHSGTEAGASLTYKLFSIGASTSFFKDDYYRSWYHYIDFNIEEIRHYFTFTPDTFSEEARSAAAHGRFKDVCGQMFVSRVNYGASMKGQAVLQTLDQAAGGSTSTTLSVGIAGLLGAHGTNTTATASITANSAYDNEVVVLGAPAAPTSGIDTVIQTAYNFPTLTTGANELISYECTPYKRLRQTPPAQYEPVPEKALASLVPLATKRERALQQANDLRFAVGKPMYQGGTPDELRPTEKFLQDIAAVVDTCETAKIQDCIKAANAIGDVPPTTLKLK